MAQRCFDIGLVGAGAISAGAYTAGVIDFTVQALDCWYAAKAADPDGAPSHDVRLRVFSGASAGAITAALGAGFIGSDQPPVASEADAAANGGRNRLFDCWVERIDIAKLLQKSDLEAKKAQVVSLLDSSVLNEIADHGLDVAPRPSRRPWLGEDFDLLLTVTNLRGVPYAFEVSGQHRETYDMLQHADFVHFSIRDAPGAGAADRHAMAWSELGGDTPAKNALKLAALASGAFPVGLAPRTLRHVIAGGGQPDWYSAREWPIPTPDSEPHRCITDTPIPARWGNALKDYEYHFQCVDGGVMNNEPLELARKLLAGPGRGHNARDGLHADRAVLLIDPFPVNAAFDRDWKAAPDVLQTLVSLFGALKNQARFKPEELMLAASQEVYSRFMIAPSRGREKHAIACGGLEGFSGFLKRDFRSHDFFLGRRNAQRFFSHHFVLPEANPLFDGWRERAALVAGHGRIVDGKRFLPIIPLVGAAAAPCYKAPWPSYSEQDLAGLVEQIEARVDVVVDRLVEQYFDTNNVVVRLIASWVLGRKKKDIVQAARRRIAGELQAMNLLN
jgi:hypothetical protein